MIPREIFYCKYLNNIKAEMLNFWLLKILLLQEVHSSCRLILTNWWVAEWVWCLSDTNVKWRIFWIIQTKSYNFYLNCVLSVSPVYLFHYFCVSCNLLSNVNISKLMCSAQVLLTCVSSPARCVLCFSISWGYSKVFQEYARAISQLYPDIRIEGENYPPTPFNRWAVTWQTPRCWIFL